MRWALAFHPKQIKELPNGRFRLLVPPMQITESCIPTAREQGWVVLACDSELMDAPIPVDPPQSNPRRVADYGEQ